MKDLIDLAMLTFNRLVEAHNELEESRLLFVYGATTATRFQIIDSAKWIIVSVDGIIKNFEDPVLDQLHDQWRSIVDRAKTINLEAKLAAMRAEFDRPAPTEGTIIEFGKSNSEWREIRL